MVVYTLIPALGKVRQDNPGYTARLSGEKKSKLDVVVCIPGILAFERQKHKDHIDSRSACAM